MKFNADKFFNVKENNSSEVSIHIYGVIGLDEEYWGEGTNNVAYELVSLLKRLDKKYSRINIHINSPGGSVVDGLAIYNTIKALKAEVHTYNDGLCASMASILYLSGSVRHMPASAILHFHSALTTLIGGYNKSELQELISTLETFDSALVAAINNSCDLSEEEIKGKWFDGKDHFFSGKESDELGFVDAVEEQEPDLPDGNVKNMDYQQLIAAYKTDRKADNFIQALMKKIPGITNRINNSTQNNIDMKTFSLKAYVFLAVMLETFDLPKDKDGNIILSEAQFKKMCDEMKSQKEELEKAAPGDTGDDSGQSQGGDGDDEPDGDGDGDDKELVALKAEMATLKAALKKVPGVKNIEEEGKGGDNGNGKSKEDGDWETINKLPHNKDYDKNF